VLKRICASGRIFNAWSDEPWINDGAAVRVSLVCFAGRNVGRIKRSGCGGDSAQIAGSAALEPAYVLNGNPVTEIYADLTGATISGAGLVTAQGCDLTTARVLAENTGISFQGSQKIGAFDIPGELARTWLNLPCNPNGRPNSDVVKPSWNGIDVARLPRDMWIIDFGTTTSEIDSSLYEAPFEYVLKHVKPEREKNNLEGYRKYWWRHGEPRIAMRAALQSFQRYIATPEVSKHRIFIWVPAHILPDKKLMVVASDSDTVFGILHSRFHEIWALKVGSWHGAGNDPRYTPATCFETFPFPVGANGIRPPLTIGEHGKNGGDPDKGACHAPLQNPYFDAIATAAITLNQLRENWLNPPEWVEWVITPQEEKVGFPKRPVARPGHEADLKKRTLTNLYNARPAWLDNAHKALDKAVAAAYGWPSDMSDEEILSRLLALNLERTKG